MQTINHFQVQAKFKFEDYRPECTKFAVFHDSPSIGVETGMALFKTQGGELSDKVLSWRDAIKRVTWQQVLVCSLFVHAT